MYNPRNYLTSDEFNDKQKSCGEVATLQAWQKYKALILTFSGLWLLWRSIAVRYFDHGNRIAAIWSKYYSNSCYMVVIYR